MIGTTLSERAAVSNEGKPGRDPLETSRRGVFAIGDVRSHSVKRVAAAVGEGAQVVATLHEYLAADRREDVVEGGVATRLAQRHDGVAGCLSGLARFR